MNKHFALSLRSAGTLALTAVALAAFASTAMAAKIKIISSDAPGVGFNDPTPVDPVGGNPGTTLGAQRLFVYETVAHKWENNLPDGPTIKVDASWPALSCTDTSGVLGAAGAQSVWRDFPGAPFPGTWYSGALANTLAGEDLDEGTDVEIVSFFNVNLGQPGCLTGGGFYLGVDNQVPLGQTNFAVVLLHELGHGLGFQALTDGQTGARIDDGTGSYPAQWERFMLDGTTGKTWFDMSDTERTASARNGRKLVWSGAHVNAAVPAVLKAGTPLLSVSSNRFPDVAGDYQVGPASFGAPLTAGAVKGEIARVIDQADGVTGLACDPFSATNTSAVAGRIALVDRGACTFATKVKNAQDAGAIGVIVADNVAGSPPASLGGADPAVIIPSVRITQADGATLKTSLSGPVDGPTRVKGRLGVDKAVRAGADAAGRAMLFTPDPYQPGSSVSHWDTLATRNQLMEPSINLDLKQKIAPPQDLTLPLLKDIGW
ncbi:MAG TPA: PA domain-containing protein [Ideonella sp.]|nr:PA domain-containing protein [Ideonella sp.]